MSAGARVRRTGSWELTRKATIRVGFRLIQAFEGLVARSSLVPVTPFLPIDGLDWVRELESSWGVVRAELDGLLARYVELPNFQEISADQASLTDDDRWKTYFFYAYGVRSERNCAACPETTRALERIPGVETAMFSILSPGKEIPPHRGPYKGVLRYHLGMVVPDDWEGCGIEVGGEVAHWKEGASLLFDDTFEHRAWNRTDQVRVVLFVDVLRPLRPPMSRANRAVIWAISKSPFIRDARRRQLQWEERFYRQEQLAR